MLQSAEHETRSPGMSYSPSETLESANSGVIRMRKNARWLSILVLLVLSAVALADSFSDGKALYKQSRYPEAVTKLEQAAKEKPADARVWWQLNFAYNKVNRHKDALNAVQKAAQLDPAHGFASDPSKYTQILSD